MILVLDDRPWLAVPWAVGGALVGLFGLHTLRPFADPLLAWYRRRNPNDPDRILMLVRDGKTETEEFARYVAEDTFWMSLPIPPLFGLCHGVLAGAVVGALCGSGAAGALSGVLIGPVVIAFLAAVTLACSVEVGGNYPVGARWARRGLLLVSPVLVLPAACHCLWAVCHSGGFKTAAARDRDGRWG